MLERLNGAVLSAHDKGDAIIDLLEAVESRLTDVVNTLEAQQAVDEYIAIPFVGVANAAGEIDIPYVHTLGYALGLVSFAATAAAGGLLLFVNGTVNQNLLYATSASQYFSDLFPDGQFIPEGSSLIVRFVGLPAATAVVVTVRARKLALARPIPLHG